jgi:hypothetical protein
MSQSKSNAAQARAQIVIPHSSRLDRDVTCISSERHRDVIFSLERGFSKRFPP